MSEILPIDGSESRRLSGIDVVLREKYPALQAIDLLVDRFGQPYYLYRITPTEGAEILQPGRTMWSAWTDRYDSEADNSFGWVIDEHPINSEEPLTGFIECVVGIRDDMRAPIVHLTHHITDVESHSSGIRLNEIQTIERYNPLASRIVIMHQNAEVYGSASFYHNDGTETYVDFEELDEIVKNLPEPKEIFVRHTIST